MQLGTNLTYTKAYNYRLIFETIHRNSPISRSNLATQTALTPQTVSNIVNRLLKTNLILEGEKVQSGRGAPSVSLNINANGAYAIGLDFDRDHLTGLLVDLSGEIRDSTIVEVDKPSPESTIDLMISTYTQLVDNLSDDPSKIIGVGIGLPGPMNVHENSHVNFDLTPDGFQDWNDVPLLDLLSEHITEPIFLENNASAAAIGERWYGSGKDVSSFLYVFFGAGLGGGLIFDGELYRGHYSNAGEIGYFPRQIYTPLNKEGEPNYVGEHFNLTELIKWFHKKDVDINHPKELGNLFELNEPHLKMWLDIGVEMLTPLILSVGYLLDPQYIILGGRIPKNILEYFTKEIANGITNQRPNEKRMISKLSSATAGSESAALGAATLPMFNLFAPQRETLMKDRKEELS